MRHPGIDLDALLAREGPLPPARAVGIIEQVADVWDEIITRGMAKDPEQRYPSAGELAGAAHSLLRDARSRNQGDGHDAPPVDNALVDEPAPAAHITTAELVSPTHVDLPQPRADSAATTTGAAALTTAVALTSSPVAPTVTDTGPRPTKTPPPSAAALAGSAVSSRPRRSTSRRRLLSAVAALVLATAVLATTLAWSVGGHLQTILPSLVPALVAAPITERTLIGHTRVNAVAAAQLNGRPVGTFVTPQFRFSRGAMYGANC